MKNEYDDTPFNLVQLDIGLNLLFIFFHRSVKLIFNIFAIFNREGINKKILSKSIPCIILTILYGQFAFKEELWDIFYFIVPVLILCSELSFYKVFDKDFDKDLKLFNSIEELNKKLQ